MNKHSLEKSGFVEVEGGRIHYRYYEPHDPVAAKRTPVIAIHGGPGGSHINMYDAVPELADERPVIYYDQLGSHFSPAEMTSELMGVERFRDEIGALIDEMGLEKATLIGHSWGGVIAIEYALQHPEKIESLILSSPLISTRRWIDDCNILLNDLPEEIQETVRRCEEEGTTNNEEYTAADEVFSVRHYCRTNPIPELVIKHRGKKNNVVYGTMWGPSEFTCLGTLRDIDLFPRLHEIRLPTLLVCGEYDTATPAAMIDARDEMEDARVTIIPDSGHGTYYDAPQGYIDAINNFLRKQEQKPAPSAAPNIPQP